MKVALKRDLEMPERILSAADKLFLEQGFAQTSTVQIARAVGCNQALIHYYYRSKELLFQSIYESKIKIFSDIFSDIDSSGGTFLERLQRRIEAHFDLLVANPLLPRLVLGEIADNPQRLAQMKQKIGHIPQAMLASLGGDLRRAIADGQVREISVVNLFINIIALNVAAFLILPAMRDIMKWTPQQIDEFMENRKKENVRTILNSLRP